MSEQRRATLTPFGKSDKKSNKSSRKTFRFNFTLCDPNEESCPVFDYGTVVKKQERKILKKHCEEKEKKPNGVLGPLNDDDDSEDVKRIAQKFEEKYGDKRKSKSYAELGAGYDETDPFIDNTEACDEELQEDQETPCGGYYVNSGPLELKRVEVSDQSDADEVAKRRQKRGLPVIEEDEEDEEENQDEEGGTSDKEAKTMPYEGAPDSKKTKISNEREDVEEKPVIHVNDLEELAKKKKKRVAEEMSMGAALIKVKKAKTVKALLDEKRIPEPPPSEEPKKQIASITSISEAIESVVNAGHNDENSNSSNCSQSATASTSTSEDSQDGKPSSQIIPPPLPENLSAEVLSLIDLIKRSAAVTDNTRKTFCTEINNGLIKLEWKSKEFSATNRNLLFAHLACYLPCTKDTLMRRAKKLFIHKEESQIDTIICKLKATIDSTMPSLLEKYAIECQRIAEEKGIAVAPTNGTSGGENQQTPDSSPTTKLPKRKFPWTEETRGYLREIIRLKNRCFKVLKPRKNTNEEYITSFLNSKIKTLWPQGWMKISALLRESTRSPHSGKSKHSSSHSPSKSDSSRLNTSVSYPLASPRSSTPHSLYVSPSPEVSHQPMISPVSGCTPLAAKNGSDPLNLLTKITTSLNTPSNKSNMHSSGTHQNIKKEKPETFSMDCLLKRTSESAISNCHDYNTTLSDLIKDECVTMNGASLPLKNVNSSQINDSSRKDKVLDLSSCNGSISGTPSVIQNVSTNERTTMRASDSVSLSAVNTDIKKHHCSSTPSPSKTETSLVDVKKPVKDVERMMTEETTTATDILSQIISESLLSPPPQPSTTTLYNTKPYEEGKGGTPSNRGQELLYESVMQDLKELNHLSSGGSKDSKKDISKNNSYSGVSWSHSNRPSELSNKAAQSQYHNEFLKHLLSTHEVPITSPAPSTTPPYSRHSVSPYENTSYMNEINKSVYNSTPHRSAQSLSSHAGSPASKVSQINQGCIMKPLPNTGISSGSESQSHQ